MVEVGNDGQIFSSQFTVEGIRKKYNENNYKIKIEKDEYATYVDVYDKKTNKKTIEYTIPKGGWLTDTIEVLKYDQQGNRKEKVLIHVVKDNTLYIGTVDKWQGKTDFSTFYNENGEIYKTRKLEEIKKGVWNITQETLYSHNKPYKVVEGDKTIANYAVDELAKFFNKKNLGIADLMKLPHLVEGITKKNVWEILNDYQTKTGRDLLDDIENIGSDNLFYKQMPVIRMQKHLENVTKYDGTFTDSWLNHNAENYIAGRLVKDLQDGNVDKFKEHLKFAGINRNKDEKKDVIELFGNIMIEKILLNFQKRGADLNKNDTSNQTKGILYTIAKSDKIPEEERAKILLDTISQIISIKNKPELTKELYDFAQNKQFVDLIINHCTTGKYCDDIKADMVLNRNNPEKLLIDFKRLEARNEVKKDRSVVSKPNGKIDIDFKQGNTGDCWLLAGVISLCKKPNGKAKLESLLKVDPKTGDVTVTLKGPKKTYKITSEEIKNANHLSGGDGDMRALELAFDKYIRELAYSEQKAFQSYDINENTTHYLYEVLFGNGKDLGKYNKSMNADINNPDKSFCLGANQFETKYSDTFNVMLNSKGEKVNFELGHAYAVIKTDSKYVYLVNPWDSKETLRITHENLEKMKPSVGVCTY